MKLKSIYRLAFLGGLVAFAGCAGDELDGVSSGSVPESVAVTLTVSRPGDASTRTVLTDNNDGTLTSKWTAGDKLLVVTSDGIKAGELTLLSGENTTTGVFTGDLAIADGTQATLWYLGASNGDAAPYTCATGSTGDKVTLTTDLSGKEGSPKLGVSFHDLKRAELLTEGDVEFTVKGGKGYVKTEGITLDQKMAMAHFSLIFPGDFAVSDGATLKVNSEKGDLPNVKTWLPANSAAEASYGYTFTIGDGKDIQISNNTADLYIPIIPGSYKLKFEVTSGSKQYSCQLQDESEIKGGWYYTSGESSDSSKPSYVGISVRLKDDSELSEVDDEVVGPTFTIKNRQGKEVKVRFTRANLHYRTKDNTWYIPQLQTDIVHTAGRANNYLGDYSKSAESIDLFRWGATGFKDERREVYSPETEYSKNRTTIKDTDLPYVSSVAVSPNSVPIDMREEKDQYVDWGWCYGYQQSGKKDYYFNDIYFTLSASEWNTLIDQYIHVCATVNDVPGLLMLDCNDDAEALALLKKYKLISADSDYVRITPSYLYEHQTAFKWNQVIIKDYNILKEMNAVFFPKAGDQLPGSSNATKPASILKLHYWLSSLVSTGIQINANNLFIRLKADGNNTSSDFIISTTNGARRWACSVRLVKVVETLKDDEIVGNK